MSKANTAPQLSSRVSRSKGGPASSSSATQRSGTSRNSNRTSAQQRRHSSPIAVPQARKANRRAPVIKTVRGGSNPEGLSSEDDDLPPTKTRKTSKTTKVTTAKEKRQANLAAAEENAARLTAETGDEGDSGEDDGFGSDGMLGNHASCLKAIDFGDSSDYDDEEAGPEVTQRPRLTRSQTTDRDEDSDGAAGLDNDDSDDDDPANSPMRPAPKKGKSIGAKFTDAVATTISSKLPAKKITTQQKIPRQGSEISSENPHTPAKTGAVASSPSYSTASLPKTPPKSVANNRRPRMCDQTPSTSGLLKASASDTRQDLFIKDAFPERTLFTEACKATFLAACADVQTTLHQKRFLKSNTYRGLILNILRQKLSQVRQEVRNAALAKTAIHYGISSTMEPAEIVALVDHLKTKIAYVFGNTDLYKQPYANPIFQILVNTLFFEGKRKSDALTNPAPWNPMPLPVIALVATAVHSVLDDWSTGKNEAAKNKFSHDKYAPIYRDHLANLAKFKQKAPAALSKLQISLWENAWLSSGSVLPDEANVYIDDDVFAEAEAEALA